MSQPGRPEWRKLRVLTVVTLVALTAQGWTGDTSNLFVTTYAAGTSSSIAGAFQVIADAGPLLIWHALEGLAIFALSLGVLGMSLRSKPKSVRICAILGTLFVVSAGVGGIMFVLAGFQSAAASAQMGGSFIGAYAFYFLELYYAK